VLYAGLAVVERDPSIESLIDLHLGASEAKAPRLLRDLQAAAFPLDHVVVADHALMLEATDAFEIFRRTDRRQGGSNSGFLDRSAR
jgi:hypothetical protein